MIDWFRRNRTSVRFAFLLRLVAMASQAVLSLVFFALLSRAMGKPLFGLFQIFLRAAQLGGMGDFGISGAVALKSGMMLGRGEDGPLRKFLASARSLFLLLAAITFIGFAGLSPWLPKWLHFQTVPGAGSLTMLFVWAGVTGAVMILAGYVNNLNYAHGTVTWPIVPGMVIGQLLAPLAHWQLAKMHEPLWIQNLPYVAATVFLGWLGWKMLKWSHPWLGELRPLGFDRSLWKVLFATSGWVYLVSVSSNIYFSTDCFVIGAGSAPGFGPVIIPAYLANYKPCLLMVTLIWAASAVSMPKITQWIASPHAADRRRAIMESHRLNIVQILLGCGAVLGYLALNDQFIKLWLGADYQCPLLWQIGFACNLAVTTGGDAGIQVAMRCGDSGVKKIGLISAGTALLNIALALLFMKLGSIAGITFAAVISQSVLSLTLGYITCRYLGLSLIRWTAKSWLLPVGVVLAAGALKFYLPREMSWHAGALGGSFAGLFLIAALLSGLNKDMVRDEWNQLRSMLKRTQ